jgi:hypothetical protein
MPDFVSSYKGRQHGHCEFTARNATNNMALVNGRKRLHKTSVFQSWPRRIAMRHLRLWIPSSKGSDMFQLKSILAVAPLALFAVSAAPAQAQYYPEPPGYVGRGPGLRVMPEHEVVTMLRSLGFTPIGRPRFQGRLWIVRAIDEDGTPMRVTVDAASGEMIDAIAIAPGPLPRSSYGMLPDDVDEPGPRYVPREPTYRPYPGETGPRVIYRDSRRDPYRDDFYDDELPPPPAAIPGPRSGFEGQQRTGVTGKNPGYDQRAVAKPADPNKRASVPSPKPRPTEISGTTVAKDPTVTGSIPPKNNEPLPPVNPLE